MTQYKSYLYFTSYYGLPAFPATPIRLALFAQFLSRTFKSVSSIQNYISGIRTMHLLLNIDPPDTSDISIRLCIRGLQRLRPGTIRRAHPITPQMLVQMAPHLEGSDHFQWACWTAVLLGFFTFARRSNLVPNSTKTFNPAQQLQRADIVRGANSLGVIFKWTKTIQCREKVLAYPVPALPGTSICPVEAYDKMLSLTPAPASAPAFSFRSKLKLLSVSKGNLQEFIKAMAVKIGLDPTFFSTHSLRRGGASWANRAGCSSLEIQTMGDWKSNCFTIYIDTSLEQRADIAEKMAKHILYKLKHTSLKD